MTLVARDLAWYEEADEKILGLVALDLPDQDYVCYVLERDAKGRFRAVWLECSLDSQERATAILEQKLAEFANAPPEEFHQGDEVGRPVDFFTPIVPPKRQHKVFSTLIGSRGYSPARALIGEMMHYFEDVDGNFVQQFQSGGFDARLWELYLYALMNELGYGLDRSYPAPDYHCQGLRGDFFIEAVTVNPSSDAPEAEGPGSRGLFRALLSLEIWKRPLLETEKEILGAATRQRLPARPGDPGLPRAARDGLEQFGPCRVPVRDPPNGTRE